MKTRIVNLVGTCMILMLWLMVPVFLIYTFDKIQKLDRITTYFDEVEKAQFEKPQFPPIETYFNGNYSGFVPYHEQMFDGYVVRLKPTYVKINSDGFRDREFSLEKNSNTFRIIMLGDSFTFGWGVELEDSIPKQLESILNRGQDNPGYEVLNFGVPGQNTFEEVEMFKDKGLKYSPDLIIIVFSSSDLDNESFKRELADNLRQGYTNKTLDQKDYSNEIQRKVLEIQESKIKNTPFSETWKIVENPMEELVSIAKQRNVLVYSLSSAWPEENNAWREFVNKHKGVYFELQNTIDWKSEGLILHTLDSHYTPLTNKLIAEKIYKTLIKQDLIPSNQK